MNETVPLSAIPHRPPFLFIDEVVEVDEVRIVTRWVADPRAPFFAGHYPGRPVVPGVLLCECCFQAGALLLATKFGGFDGAEGIPVVTRIRDARFRRMVLPGDALTVEVVLDDALDEAFDLTGRGSVGEELAVRVSFACMRIKEQNP